jgi:hypothetical protein
MLLKGRPLGRCERCSKLGKSSILCFCYSSDTYARFIARSVRTFTHNAVTDCCSICCSFARQVTGLFYAMFTLFFLK